MSRRPNTNLGRTPRWQDSTSETISQFLADVILEIAVISPDSPKSCPNPPGSPTDRNLLPPPMSTIKSHRPNGYLLTRPIDLKHKPGGIRSLPLSQSNRLHNAGEIEDPGESRSDRVDYGAISVGFRCRWKWTCHCRHTQRNCTGCRRWIRARSLPPVHLIESSLEEAVDEENRRHQTDKLKLLVNQ